MGRSGPTGTVTFSPTNLLRQWRTDGALGISRRPQVDVRGVGARVSGQALTLAMGGLRPNAVFDTGPLVVGGFDEMEGDPHGNAHTSFDGWLRSASTAPRDPLFFLLHCNVDRLWALWQWFNDRFDGTRANTYFFRGAAGPGGALIGHNLRDTLWPWNNATTPPRPNTAPRTPFPSTPTAVAPGPSPRVGDMIDYQGFRNPASDMNFAYDDVPYGIA